MQIDFPAEAGAYRDSNLTVEFDAIVNGERVRCAISVEALEDHFGVVSNDRDGWIRAFDRGRARILETAREHLKRCDGHPVLLKSGHFRPGDALRG
ncbi:DUF1488 domain-containing protein [Mycetohabitans sp. B46]|uniref:DUF1488 domain-containing protein n=1 Tax=Mycetohabitans sp. B46 TaxID=2772536 RepID=UPI00307CE549